LNVEAIGLYKAQRPEFVLVSSAGTERINVLSTEAERARDIPIVALNPQGILNWKYKAEETLRYSGLPYTVIRATGLIGNNAVNDTRKFQVFQEDNIAGRITRPELARVVSAVVTNPYSAGKTFEVRRDESDSGIIRRSASVDGAEAATGNFGKEQDMFKTFRALVPDNERVVRGLRPFPLAKPPPPPVSEQRTKEILADPRVQAAQARDREAREGTKP